MNSPDNVSLDARQCDSKLMLQKEVSRGTLYLLIVRN